MCCLFFFFFSSRRRHTRCSRDWSSDVCSSDLAGPFVGRADLKWRALTTYTGDNGLWITDLNWTSDGNTIVYVRGDGANRQGENPNPAQLQDGTEQAVFAVAIDGGTRSEEHTSE